MRVMVMVVAVVVMMLVAVPVVMFMIMFVVVMFVCHISCVFFLVFQFAKILTFPDIEPSPLVVRRFRAPK